MEVFHKKNGELPLMRGEHTFPFGEAYNNTATNNGPLCSLLMAILNSTNVVWWQLYLPLPIIKRDYFSGLISFTRSCLLTVPR